MGERLKREQIQGIAALARLRPSPEDEPVLLAHLGAILEYVAKLEELDTGATPPSPSVLKPIPLWRPDVPAPSLPPEDSLRSSPEREGEFFKVPRVIGSDG